MVLITDEVPAADAVEEQPPAEDVIDNMDDEELDDADDGQEKKYVKKEYVARPYDSEFVKQTEEEVHALSIKNQR